MAERRNTHKILVGKPEGKVPLGRCSSRWKNNNKKDLEENWYSTEWIHLVWDRDQSQVPVNMEINHLLEPELYA
jgi:hypothetical protein